MPSLDDMVSAIAALREKTDEELLKFGLHCYRIGVNPQSVLGIAIGAELVRRGFVSTNSPGGDA